MFEVCTICVGMFDVYVFVYVGCMIVCDLCVVCDCVFYVVFDSCMYCFELLYDCQWSCYHLRMFVCLNIA